MAKKNWKRIHEAERRRQERIDLALRKQEEYEEKLDQDEQGVLRRRRSGYNDGWFSTKSIRIIKIALLVAMPISFFLYSPLLFPLVLIYGLLYFPIKTQERKLNRGLRKDLWITLPKFDSVIAFAAIITITSIVGISMLTSGASQSQFAGKNEAQIYQILTSQGMNSGTAQTRAKEIIANGETMTRWDKVVLQSATLLTGHRELFATKNESVMNLGGANVVKRAPQTNNNSGGGGGQSNNNNNSGQQTLKIKNPDGSVETHQGTRDELDKIAAQWHKNNGLGNVPLMQTLTQTFKTISIIMLVVVFAGGVFIVLWKKEEKLI